MDGQMDRQTVSAPSETRARASSGDQVPGQSASPGAGTLGPAGSGGIWKGQLGEE